jgi:hypothetical protein
MLILRIGRRAIDSDAIGKQHQPLIKTTSSLSGSLSSGDDDLSDRNVATVPITNSNTQFLKKSFQPTAKK